MNKKSLIKSKDCISIDNPIVFPKEKFIFDKETDEFLTKIISEREDTYRDVPEKLKKNFLK